MERKKGVINNTFYEELHKKWHTESAHPIALLRSENKLRNPWLHEIVKKHYPQKAKVLDIGCGAGLLTNYLASLGHSVTGVDLSPSSLKMAKETDTTQSIDYREENGCALSFPSESFDVVCAMDLLEHVENPEALIQEASRVLKKGGLFFFHTFSRNFFSWLIVIKGVEWTVKNTPKNMHVYPLFINPSELAAFCQKHSLQVEKFVGVRPDFFHKSFWKMLLTGSVQEDFRFVFTPSLKTGYSGFAIKN